MCLLWRQKAKFYGSSLSQKNIPACDSVNIKKRQYDRAPKYKAPSMTKLYSIKQKKNQTK